MSTAIASGYGASGREPWPRALGPLLACGAIVTGLVAGQLVASGRAAAVPALGVVLLPVILWKRAELGPAVLVVAALGVEQFDHFGGSGPRVGALTSHIPLFHGLGAVPLNHADLLLCLLFAIYVARTPVGGTRPLPGPALKKGIYCLLGVVALGILVGISHGGDARIALMEARPYAYLGATFVLASVLVKTRAAIRAVLWGFVVAIGLKATQGLVIFLSVRHLTPRPESVLGHEEAVFFALFLLLTVALWLFEVSGPLRTTATLLAPVVLAADLANARRAAWLVLLAGCLTLAIVGSAVLPGRRKFIRRLLTGVALVAAVYLPAYWNGTGGLAQPARAIRSEVAPSPRDESSNLYRVQEDANLLFNIREGGPFGKGFGVQINYALPIVDLTESNPFIAYVPHNGVFYILMRMGVLGGVAFWSVLGLGIVAACRLAKSADRELALLGALTVSVLIAYAFEGGVDQGFFFYRIAFVVGTLLGLTRAAQRLSAVDSENERPESTVSPRRAVRT